MTPKHLYYIACRGCSFDGCKGGVWCAGTWDLHHDPPIVLSARVAAEAARKQADRTCAFRPHRLVGFVRRGA